MPGLKKRWIDAALLALPIAAWANGASFVTSEVSATGNLVPLQKHQITLEKE